MSIFIFAKSVSMLKQKSADEDVDMQKRAGCCSPPVLPGKRGPASRPAP
ncbi:hypothetical protein HMPREF3213_02248 [Heyndrickxia coagulans]|uniref:Uncharacterized protein n=1 Tax=Heyndrickxia coagulans TaxID=1398 RepID=A0A133KMB2_HEYCO|nr:hypothetical protein HMPREF3213_02248 [Heyndrickxia coagulans]